MTTTLAFVCVQNAGRSQMAAVFAEREAERRGLGDRVEVLTGGTRPADSVHDAVRDAMADAGFDLSDRQPREVDRETLGNCDYVATMGCSTLDLGAVAGVDVRDWALADPDGADAETVREIRDEVERRVVALFDELARAETERGR
ncbi:arsenate-mycothiol transferase ArsC [Halobacterium jilantaiense]|uniref:Protein-tyrosine-phosphatase n=1 Tax=Halobacterium jilantaiense TaxID=355548 RepID=A0A1I0Q2H4_9EURY|nr:low molecular weight phosphatase family protein [Halobacterium jilantaiense]SEW20983.1 Protein-tyrosine-phosphatase [Halobacterium jilantaiense]